MIGCTCMVIKSYDMKKVKIVINKDNENLLFLVQNAFYEKRKINR
jgi:hypothetical protein